MDFLISPRRLDESSSKIQLNFLNEYLMLSNFTFFRLFLVCKITWRVAQLERALSLMRIFFLLEVLVFVDLPKSAETNSVNHQVKIYYIVLDF